MAAWAGRPVRCSEATRGCAHRLGSGGRWLSQLSVIAARTGLLRSPHRLSHGPGTEPRTAASPFLFFGVSRIRDKATTVGACRPTLAGRATRRGLRGQPLSEPTSNVPAESKNEVERLAAYHTGASGQPL